MDTTTPLTQLPDNADEDLVNKILSELEKKENGEHVDEQIPDENDSVYETPSETLPVSKKIKPVPFSHYEVPENPGMWAKVIKHLSNVEFIKYFKLAITAGILFFIFTLFAPKLIPYLAKIPFAIVDLNITNIGLMILSIAFSIVFFCVSFFLFH